MQCSMPHLSGAASGAVFLAGDVHTRQKNWAGVRIQRTRPGQWLLWGGRCQPVTPFCLRISWHQWSSSQATQQPRIPSRLLLSFGGLGTWLILLQSWDTRVFVAAGFRLGMWTIAWLLAWEPGALSANQRPGMGPGTNQRPGIVHGKMGTELSGLTGGNHVSSAYTYYPIPNLWSFSFPPK